MTYKQKYFQISKYTMLFYLSFYSYFWFNWSDCKPLTQPSEHYKVCYATVDLFLYSHIQTAFFINPSKVVH